jgi:hypothetical protein
VGEQLEALMSDSFTIVEPDAKPAQLWKLTQPRPDLVKAPPEGKYGKYIGHDDIEQLALAIAGPHSFEVVEVVRGYIPAWTSRDKKKTNPERPHGIVGVLARLTALIDGRILAVTEVGDSGDAIKTDGENLKAAASDAYKRCWMRHGLALNLWVEQGQHPSTYWIHDIIAKANQADAGACPFCGAVPEAPAAE